MLEVTFYRDGRDRLSRFCACGHAEFAEHGEDIVCAAVSAILQAARLGLEAHARIACEVEQHAGNLDLRIPEAARADAAVQAIVATAELSVEQIARQYPAHVTYRRQTG